MASGKTLDLYHFTSYAGVNGIITDTLVKPGRVVVFDVPISDTAVCLTSDSDWVGHGLIHSSPSSQNASKFEHDNNRSRVRLKFRLRADDPSLAKLDTFKFVSAEMLAALEITANFPNQKLSLEELRQYRNERSSEIKRKGHTWWYYFAPLPITYLIEMATLDAVGNYKILGQFEGGS